MGFAVTLQQQITPKKNEKIQNCIQRFKSKVKTPYFQTLTNTQNDTN